MRCRSDRAGFARRCPTQLVKPDRAAYGKAPRWQLPPAGFVCRAAAWARIRPRLRGVRVSGSSGSWPGPGMADGCCPIAVFRQGTRCLLCRRGFAQPFRSLVGGQDGPARLPPARLRLRPAPRTDVSRRLWRRVRGIPTEGFPGQREARPPGPVCLGNSPDASAPLNPTGPCPGMIPRADPPRQGPDRRRMDDFLPPIRRVSGPANPDRRSRPPGSNPGQRGAESSHP